MKAFDLKKEMLPLTILVLPVLYLILVWNKIPVSIPTHFTMAGEANGYSPKYLLAIVTWAIYILFYFLPLIDPRKENYKKFENAYYKIKVIYAVFMSVIQFIILVNVQYHNVNMTKIMPISLFILFAALGNFMGNIRPNSFVGIKVPWTLWNEEVWKRTHRFAGYLWFWGSLIGIVITLVISRPEYVLISILTIITLVPIVYSGILYNKINSKRL